MMVWATAREILEFSIQELPTTLPGIRHRLDGLRIPTRKRAARGGGIEYDTSKLPDPIAATIAGQPSITDEILIERSAAPVSGGGRMDARVWVLNRWRSWNVASHKGRTAGLKIFAHEYENGAIDVPDWVRKELPKFSANSLRNWEKQASADGVTALGGRYGNRKGAGLIDTDDEVRAVVLGMIYDKGRPKAEMVFEALSIRFEASRVPSVRSIARWMQEFRRKNEQAIMAVTDPDGYRSKFQAASGSASENIIRLNQVWELDSTIADMMLSDGRRHAIIGCIDVYSRRVRFQISRTSSSAAIASTLRRCIGEWGIPEIIKTDNGADYVSRHISRIAAHLEIHQSICPPFTPQAKPHIERVFKTFLHSLAELMPSYVGHSVADRKAIEGRRSFANRMMSKGETVEVALSPDELQAACDRWTENFYGQRKHGSLGCSPFEKAASWTGAVRKIANARALDLLLMPAADGDGFRTVGKKGIKLEGEFFDAKELGGYEGQRVLVLLDDAEAGHCYVFEEDGKTFVAKALCPERLGISRLEIKGRRAAMQAAAVRETSAILRGAAKSARTADVWSEILAGAEASSAKVSAFPPRSQEYSTAALDAAAIAESDEGGNVQSLPRLPRAPEKRPGFMSDADLALHLIKHPQEITGQHLTHFKAVLSIRNTRMLFDANGIDADNFLNLLEQNNAQGLCAHGKFEAVS